MTRPARRYTTGRRYSAPEGVARLVMQLGALKNAERAAMIYAGDCQAELEDLELTRTTADRQEVTEKLVNASEAAEVYKHARLAVEQLHWLEQQGYTLQNVLEAAQECA